ncbi:MAG: molybdate ABC transporter substrate-binding protein [Nitrospira sp.]|nr:molybdate ABC transporter substrate-binding protein [Nitrospira sp.]TKB72519.1 MAG: molybdate ABC transporter substrate-binding protein [Nitrospira sp.]
MIRAIIALCMLLMPGVNVAIAEVITIAAASDLNFVFRELVAEYEQLTGDRVRLSLGSSGNFYAQIQNGAPFDLYFSADIAYPRKLEEAGLTVPGSLYSYAIGRIVLWAGKDSRFDLSKGLEILRESTVKKIAIANPKHAPYGRAAVGAMEQAQVYDRVKDKLVFGENISQAAQFVESGAADIGIIAMSLALAPPMQAAGRYWEIPADVHPPIEQGAVIIKGAKNQERAKAFLSFVQSAEGQAMMKRYGFIVPSSEIRP